jgi:hypothetical protein
VGDSENLENKQKALRAMMERKSNLYKKLSPNTLSYEDMTAEDQTEFDQILTTRITEHSGEYSMMYSLDKSRFNKTVDTLDGSLKL